MNRVWDEFVSGAYDLAFTPKLPFRGTVRAEALCTDPVLFFAAPGHRLAGRRDVPFAEMRDALLVGKFSDGYWGRVKADLDQRGCSFAQCVDLDSPEAVKRVVLSGIGPGMLFASALQKELASGELIAFTVDGIVHEQTYYLVRPPTELSPLAERFCTFMRERPRAVVDMRIMPVSTLWHAFEAEPFDFAIAPSQGRPKYLTSEELYQDRVVFFAAPDAPIANKAVVTLDELNAQTLIGKFVDSHWRRIFRELEETGFRPKRRVTIIAPEAVKRMVARGVGVGVLFEASIKRELAEGVFRRIELSTPSMRESFCLATSPAKGVLSPVAEKFLTHVRACFSAVGAR